MNLKKILLSIIYFNILFISCNKALGEEKSETATAKEQPTRIRSNIIDIKRKTQVVNFIGNVVVEKEDSSLLAQKMIMLYNEEDKNDLNSNKSSIKRIDAKENVRVFSSEYIASGDTGYYDPNKDIFVLEQNVIVNNGSSIASGEKFIYNIKTKKGHFVGREGKEFSQERSLNKSEDKRVMVIIGEDKK